MKNRKDVEKAGNSMRKLWNYPLSVSGQDKMEMRNTKQLNIAKTQKSDENTRTGFFEWHNLCKKTGKSMQNHELFRCLMPEISFEKSFILIAKSFIGGER